ncbi:membrane protein [Ornithinibacillus bavariensis]|uniref:Membrane protein n=1 Tax=Ornithinibacillus bavariensis TaxID=545502 RepID=A0A919XA14_9BACI|nr:anthrone oxygenase family protein [Ornithinibacillus bavariensis]GIO28306.1 membrane protein [Ornithinibacillus bavariensis]
MIEKITSLLTLFAALGSGLIAGTFFAFSAFVMNALARLPSHQGIAAMQSINIVVLNRLFLTVFTGTAVVSFILILISLFNWKDTDVVFILSGSLLYLLGSFLVTGVCNVPLNDSLANLDVKDAASATQWKEYIVIWKAWNHVRTIASLAAMVLFILALWRI